MRSLIATQRPGFGHALLPVAFGPGLGASADRVVHEAHGAIFEVPHRANHAAQGPRLPSKKRALTG